MSEQVQAPPATVNPVARLIGVIVSPRETFEQIAANPSWLFPLIVYMVVLSGALLIFNQRADMEAMLRAQLEDGPASAFLSEAQIDDAIREATGRLREMSRTQIAVSNTLPAAVFTPGVGQFFVLIYASLFVMMGALGKLRLGRAWLYLLFCVCVAVAYGIISFISTLVFKESPPSHLLLTSAAGLGTIVVWLMFLGKAAKDDLEFHRMLGVVTHSSAVLIIAMLALAVVSLTTTPPIVTGADKLVPSYVGAFLKTDVGIVDSLLNSLDVFTIWLLSILSIGFSVVTKTSIGLSASITFLPWALIVLIKLAFAAAVGGA